VRKKVAMQHYIRGGLSNLDMKSQYLDILLVDSQPDTIRLVEEAFTEFEETRYRRGWTQSMRMLLAADTAEAGDLLAVQRFDAILLHLGGLDGEPLPAFLQLRAATPDTPLVILAPATDEPLALSLLRQGAQDYLLLEDLDCWPMMRALRCAMERQKVARARQSLALHDELTQLYNERGFRHLAARHAQIAARHGMHLALALTTLPASEDDDLADLSLAEAWRSLFEPCDLTARLSQHRFAAASLLASHDEALVLERRLALSVPTPAVSLLSPALCATEFELHLNELLNQHRRLSASAASCDNWSFENRAGRHL
jgi:DNA-binding NarL/FixJ family response regulator